MRGYSNDGGPRQRSGPRAHGGKFGKPGGGGPGGGYAGGHDHRRSGPEGFKGPGRGQRPPNRARGEVDGNAGASAAPRQEVNGNVAPPNEKPQIPDDD
jgi:hypothetical protein